MHLQEIVLGMCSTETLNSVSNPNPANKCMSPFVIRHYLQQLRSQANITPSCILDDGTTAGEFALAYMRHKDQTNSTSNKKMSEKNRAMRKKIKVKEALLCEFEGCIYSTRDLSRLRRHRCIHTNDKPFVCTFEKCEFKTAHKDSLAQHKRVHSGIKSYACDFDGCIYKARTKSHLITHNRTHTNIKPFVCDHCSFKTAYRTSLQRHNDLHEQQSSYPILCRMQEGGTQIFKEDGICCTVRTQTEQDMAYHIERNHTVEGIGRKFHSETKLAAFFDSKNIVYDRDWANRVSFRSCKSIEGGHVSARPDFFLLQKSADLNVVFLVGNDEFEHRFYPCDSRRTHNIVQALEQTSEFRSVPIVYVRFNPHHHWRDNKLFSYSLEQGHDILLNTIESVQKEDIRPGLNLVYVHYDQTEGQLDIFRDTKENDFAELHKGCVIKLV